MTHPSGLPAPERILVVDDEPNIRDTISLTLRREGFDVVLAETGLEALERMDPRPDIVVLDIMLPGLDGLEVLRRIRMESSVPIILLSARGEEIDRVVGLEIGADDYLTKPFDFTELMARLRALLRRSGGAPAPVLRAGPVELDPAKREVRLDGSPVSLTPKEFALLEYLLRNPDRPLSRATLMEHVWGIRFDPGTNVVDVFINALRNKVDPERRLIRTVRGVGYMIRAGQPEAPE